MLKILAALALLGSAVVVDIEPEQVDVTLWTDCAVYDAEIICNGSLEGN